MHTPTAPDLEGPIEMDTLPGRDRSRSRSRTLESQLILERRDYAVGIALLLLVVLLWTLSNFVTQDLYEGGYDKPFFITYMNTSAFSLYLIPLLVRRFLSRGHTFKSSIDQGYQPLLLEDEAEESSSRGPLSQPSLADDHLAPLTDRQTAGLAFAFCLLWFVANWTVNASLNYTSVASATVLSSMSGFFTLGIGKIFGVEKFTLLKIGAVFTSFMGVLLVSLSDSKVSGAVGTEYFPTDFGSRATLGDFLALSSALFYAMYVILLKVRIKSESRIDMQMFFGFVGLFNIIVCWPIGLVLHLTGGEIFEFPSNQQTWYGILINMAITLSSDYIYVLAMLKTTPLVVTIGLSLTIPVAVIGDFVRLRPAKGGVIVGALLVLAGFVAIGAGNVKEEPEGQNRRVLEEQII